MNPFDQAARYAAKQLDAEGFLRWLMPDIFVAWRWRGWLDTQSIAFPGEPERRSDTVAAFERLAGDAPPAALVVEFQSRPLGPILERLAEYALRVRREKSQQTDPRVSYTVTAVVVNLTGPEQADEWEMAPPDFVDLGLHIRVKVRTLREEDGLQLLTNIEQGRVARCVLPWVALMRGGDDPAVVEYWKRLASAEVDPHKRGDYGGLARVFAELCGRGQLWTKALEGWNVEVSQVVLEWQAQALERGLAQGRAEMLPLLRENLMELMRTRFQAELPVEFLTAVQNQTDPALLRQWFHRTLAAASLEELRGTFGLR